MQHICEGFLPGLAEWLDRSCALSVKVARHGEPLERGKVYFAPDNLHMEVANGGRIVLSDAPPENNVRPSVSHLFRSVAATFGKRVAGVLLTGMGADGSQELKSIRDNGGITIAQDEKSSVVNGMPGVAVKLGAAEHVLPPEMIAEILKRLVAKRRGR